MFVLMGGAKRLWKQGKGARAEAEKEGHFHRAKKMFDL
jgi:hypothetical protein